MKLIILHHSLLLLVCIYKLFICFFVNSSNSSKGNPGQINAQIAQQLRVTAQRDIKDRATRKANLMQARYESEIQELISKQQWYQKHQNVMTKEDELEYQRLCQESQFRLHILEERLKRFVSPFFFGKANRIFCFFLDTKNCQKINLCSWTLNSMKIFA